MYTKKNIETIVEEFKKLLEEHDCLRDVSIYYNNKRVYWLNMEWNRETKEYQEAKIWVDEGEGYHPKKYCQYAPDTNIISFSSEGELGDRIYDYGVPEWLDDFADKYCLYTECATSWFFFFAPTGDWDEWETDNIKADNSKTENQKPVYLYRDDDYKELPELRIVANFWEKLCTKSKDEGSCALGYGMFFIYQGTKYKMIPRSNKQGEWSWTQWVDIIKSCLADIGCTNIYWDCGRLD